MQARLGLTEIPALRHLTEDKLYDRIRGLPEVTTAEEGLQVDAKFELVKKMFGLTVLGAAFKEACIDEPKEQIRITIKGIAKASLRVFVYAHS